jgi:protein O-GlcNAc transferase
VSDAADILDAAFARLARFRPAPRGVIRIGAPTDAEVAVLRRAPPERLLVFTAHEPTAERLRGRLAGLPLCEVDAAAISGRAGPLWFACDPHGDDPRPVVDGVPPPGGGDLFKTAGRPLAVRLLQLGLSPTSFDLLWIGEGSDVADLLTGGITGVLSAFDAVLTPAGPGAPTRFDPFMFDQGFVRLRPGRLKPGAAGEPRIYVRSSSVESWDDLARGGDGRVTMSNLGRNGRFANQLFQYAHIKMYGLRRGAEVHAPSWIGDTLFGCDDPRDVDGPAKLPMGAFDMEGYALWSDPTPPTDVDFQGYYQIVPHSWRTHHRNLLRRLLTPTPAVAGPTDAWLAGLRRDGGVLVGLHVRRGDYVALGPLVPWFTPVPVEMYRAWLAEIWPTLRNPTLLIATDEPDEILPQFADYRPVSTAGLPAPAPEADFFPDFHALSRCDLLAMCNSSFSRMAALSAPRQSCWLPDLSQGRFVPYDPWTDDSFWDRFRTLEEPYRQWSRATVKRLTPDRPTPPPGAAETAAEAERVVARCFLKDGARVADTATADGWARRLADEQPQIVVLRAVGARDRLDALHRDHGVDRIDLLRIAVTENGDENNGGGNDDWAAALRVLDGAAGLLDTGRVVMLQISYPVPRPELAELCARLRRANYRLYRVGTERLGALPLPRPETDASSSRQADMLPGVLLAVTERSAATVIGQGRPALDIDGLLRAHAPAGGVVADLDAAPADGPIALLRADSRPDGVKALSRAPAVSARTQATTVQVFFRSPPADGVLIEDADAALAAQGFRRVACACPDGPDQGVAFYRRVAPPQPPTQPPAPPTDPRSAAQRAVDAGLAHHHAGRPAEAAALYRQALAADGDCDPALHLLGVLTLQAGQADQATDLLSRAIRLRPTSAEYRLNLGVALRALGRPAATVYRSALALDPQQAALYVNFGNACAAEGAAEQTVAAYGRAVTLTPDHLGARQSLGAALFAARRFVEAAAIFREGVRVAPQRAELLVNLGLTEQKLGRLDAARTAFERAVELEPADAGAATNLAVVLYLTGRANEAVAVCRDALRRRFDSSELHAASATALQAAGDPAAAVDAYRRSLALTPTAARSWSNLGVALQAAGKPPVAVAAQQRAWRSAPGDENTGRALAGALHAAGRLIEAEKAICKTIACHPQSAESYETLASVRHDQRRVGSAVQFHRRSLTVNPQSPTALNGCGNSLLLLNQATQARTCFQRALALDPTQVNANNNMGGVARNRGDQAGAVAYFRRALRAGGPDGRIHSNLLLTLCYQEGVSRPDLLREHLEWGALHAEPLTAVAAPHADDPDPDRRLKIAYVSPDLRDHAAAYFLEPLFENHDHARHHITAYAEVISPDEVTARLRAHTDDWVSTVGMSDEDLAARIRADRIDVLIDLGGHTAHNRITALARKPAPVQAHYLGYPATCGMTAFDYHIIDSWVAPEGWEDPWFLEKLWRLPRTLRCYKGPRHSTPVNPLPALSDGRITFGSLNAFVKVGPEVVALWARILRRIPSSRLLVVANIEPETLHALFAPHGVGPGRLVLTPRRPLDQFFTLFHEVDVALDPFPHAGGTTTFHSLWMGVPVVSLAGRGIPERGGVGVLGPVGLTDFIAETPEEYIAVAERCAADIPALARLRAGLREQMQASPLLDGPGFARDFESACREMWRRWCAGRGSAI